MSSDIAIKVDNLSKCYHIYDTPGDRLKQFVLPKLQKTFGLMPKQYFTEHWALKDASFEIKKGETIGVVGRNGSGKSTLLQLICGTLNLTSGIVQTKGRVAALLELGSGFNPEFTGRENAYLYASILGLNVSDIDAQLNEITTFADIGDFIEQPIKTYSSGMIVRLAFAVAINASPDILIVDEALSVGDELFQRKCFSRIEAIRKAGATILFVSHAGGTIVELCDRAVLLDAGEILAIGKPSQIVGRYQKLIYAPPETREYLREEIRLENTISLSHKAEAKHGPPMLATNKPLPAQFQEWPDSYDPALKPMSTIAYVSHGATIHTPEIYTTTGDRVNNLTRGKTYRYRYTVSFECAAKNLRFGMLIKTISGVELGGGISAASSQTTLPFVEAGKDYAVEFEFCCRLNSGVYFLNAGVLGELNGREKYLHRLIDAAIFRVISENGSPSTGIVDFSCLATVKKT
jgi:lipopolysaccharide transport system ATP-binding protein